MGQACATPKHYKCLVISSSMLFVILKLYFIYRSHSPTSSIFKIKIMLIVAVFEFLFHLFHFYFVYCFSRPPKWMDMMIVGPIYSAYTLCTKNYTLVQAAILQLFDYVYSTIIFTHTHYFQYRLKCVYIMFASIIAHKRRVTSIFNDSTM